MKKNPLRCAERSCMGRAAIIPPARRAARGCMGWRNHNPTRPTKIGRARGRFMKAVRLLRSPYTFHIQSNPSAALRAVAWAEPLSSHPPDKDRSGAWAFYESCKAIAVAV